MEGAASERSAKLIEASLANLPGVAWARVSVRNSYGVEKIRLGLLPRPPAVELIEETQALLAERFGLRVDPERIHLVEAGVESGAPAPQRLKLLSITRVAGQVEVVLGDGGKRYAARAPIISDLAVRDELLAAARATAAALEAALGHSRGLVVREAKLVGLDGQAVTLVGLRASDDEFLVGACAVRGDGADAAARATLKAVNRRWALWCEGSR